MAAYAPERSGFVYTFTIPPGHVASAFDTAKMVPLLYIPAYLAVPSPLISKGPPPPLLMVPFVPASIPIKPSVWSDEGMSGPNWYIAPYTVPDKSPDTLN